MYEVYSADGADGLMDYLGQTWMPAVQRTVPGTVGGAEARWSRRTTGPPPRAASTSGSPATCGSPRLGARFAESYVNLGMVPVAGGMYLLPRIVGQSAAMELLASGRIIDVTRAKELGLVDEVCAPGDLMAQATELAERLTRGPAATVTATQEGGTAGRRAGARRRAAVEPRSEHRAHRP